MATPRASARGGLSRRGGTEALALICAPLKYGDGFRHLWLGNTGRGKTFASKRLVSIPGQIVFIHDDSKAQPEFPHIPYFESPDVLLAQPYDQVAHHKAVAFRGDDRRGRVCEVEEVCQLGMMFARAGVPARIVIDETSRAMSDTGKKLLAPTLRTACTRGRTMGLSISASAQEVKFAPPVLLGQASSAALFQLESHDCNYLRERLWWDPAMLDVVARLDVGDFVIRVPATPWDRCVYRFSAGGV